jgi:hypothetical protein
MVRWQDKYIYYYDKYKNRIEACSRAGCKMSEVFNAINQDHEDYDEEFAERHREIDLRHAVEIEDDLKRKAIVESKDDIQKFLLPTLPVVGDKYRKGLKADVPVQNFLSVTFSLAGRDRAVSKLTEVFSAEVEENDTKRLPEGSDSWFTTGV